ncbi:hypothetical protein FA15DRAFT_665341 [Coprinopsis marcescibilis]|uniref:Uncharacterized protein n=1 Tax=Coprinopsis marcescibilis TaxID=230819 RepID=A0A5C3LII9_COPMA|nr:hypothetical protein FA15DRAFT_665341 [Coprinopsis marcescibilis]
MSKHSSSSNPRLEEIAKSELHDLTSQDIVVIVVGTLGAATAKKFINGYAQADVAKQQSKAVDDDGIDQLFVEELPGSKPQSKKRLVLASVSSVAGFYYLNRDETGPFVLANNWFMAHCNVSPTAFVYVTFPKYYITNCHWDHLSMFSGFLEKVPCGAAKTLFVTRGTDWQITGPGDYEGLSAEFGELIREGAEHMHLTGGTTESDVIRYIVGGRNARKEEEMTGGKPLVSTKAGNLFKKTLETLVADAFSNRKVG